MKKKKRFGRQKKEGKWKENQWRGSEWIKEKRKKKEKWRKIGKESDKGRKEDVKNLKKI